MSPQRGQQTRGAGTARKRAARQRRIVLGWGAAAILASVGLLYVAFKSPTGVPLQPYYNVEASFKTIGTLNIGADVTVAGKLVGQVVDIHMHDRQPTVDLQLNSGTRHLPVGTTARIRPRGLLGAEYVDLSPTGARQTIPNGGSIPESHTSAAEQVSDVYAGLTPAARLHLQQVINGLGGGFLGRGVQLNQTLSTAPATLENLRHGLGPLIHSAGLPGLIAGANALNTQLDPVTGDFSPGMRLGAKSLAPFRAEAGPVSTLLEQAPAEITSIDTSLASVDTTLAHLSAFARQATAFTALAPRALTSLTRVLVDHGPLSSARTLLIRLGGAISPTEQLTGTLNPELPHLSRLFDVLTPVLNTIAPYGCDFTGFAHNWRGFLGVGVPTQPGPLGPSTILRLAISAPGTQIAGSSTPATPHDANPAPCVGVGGP
ncbi:MAG TPA: MlaD family protein [Solirubrobacteraceae bacterium]|nr:MlaD family protein [Solirubrobacteraceae bacterium]